MSRSGVAYVRQNTQVFNVRDWGATGNGVTDDTAAIQVAITAALVFGGTVFFPGGTYLISAALSVVVQATGGINVTFKGAGARSSIIKQTAANTDCIVFSGPSLVSYPAVKNLMLQGTGAGTGRGIVASANAGASPVYGMVLRELFIYQMGGAGVDVTTCLISTIDTVEVASSGAGFYLHGNCTSTVLKNCYANGNTQGRGYYIVNMTYGSLQSCASDSNAIGYEINGGKEVALTGCGTENTVAANGLDGTGYKINGGTGHTLTACLSVNNNAIAFYALNSAVNATFISCQELAPGGGATASFNMDVTTSSTIISPTNATAMALSGTYSIISSAASLIRAVTMIGITCFGNLDISQVGSGIAVAEGVNGKQGVVTLVGGTATVTNGNTTATSRIMLTAQTSGAAPGALRVSARVPGTSFTITSTSGTDTSVVAYEMFEVG